MNEQLCWLIGATTSIVRPNLDDLSYLLQGKLSIKLELVRLE